MAKRKAQTTGSVQYVGDTDIPIPDNLPTIVDGQKLERSDQLIVAEFICTLYASNKFTLKNCLAEVGIRSSSTWHSWRKSVESIDQMWVKAKEAKSQVYRSTIQEMAVTSLERQITGYWVDGEEVTEHVEFVYPRDENGFIIDGSEPIAEVVTSRSRKKKKIYVKPSPTATIFALTNLDPKNFKRNPTEEDEANREVNIPVISWVD